MGTLADGGHTISLLDTAIGQSPAGTVDFVFIDHDKRSCVDDLQTITENGWLHPGSIVLADNVGYAGAPRYRRYMRRQEGVHWQTDEHRVHAAYQSLIPDLVLESEFSRRLAASSSAMVAAMRRERLATAPSKPGRDSKPRNHNP